MMKVMIGSAKSQVIEWFVMSRCGGLVVFAVPIDVSKRVSCNHNLNIFKIDLND